MRLQPRHLIDRLCRLHGPGSVDHSDLVDLRAAVAEREPERHREQQRKPEYPEQHAGLAPELAHADEQQLHQRAIGDVHVGLPPVCSDSPIVLPVSSTNTSSRVACLVTRRLGRAPAALTASSTEGRATWISFTASLSPAPSTWHATTPRTAASCAACMSGSVSSSMISSL